MTKPSMQALQHAVASEMERREWAQAALTAAICRTQYPDDASGWLLGSFVALLADDKQAALTLVEERLSVEPGHLPCLLQRAECLLALGRRTDALAAADAACARAEGDASALTAIAAFLVHAREHARAVSVYDRAITAAPDDAALKSRRADVQCFLGAFDLAALDYDSVLAVDGANAEALKALSELERQTADHNSIARLEAALARNPDDRAQSIPLHFALARAYESVRDHSASWRHVSTGNALERAQMRYQPSQDRAVIDRLICAFPDLEPTAPDTTGERPIFIVGLPRTGTTLLERIVGSHSQVHPAGELSAFSEAVSAILDRERPVEQLDWVEFAALLGGVDAASLAAEYRARSQVWRGDKARFTDKQPTNFYYCPLILRAFPRACILHVTRHPLAASYAIYKTRFRGTYPFAYELGELADFYIAYRRMMSHWHRILPGRILDVAYEDIVSAQKSTTRMVLDFCGLDFEEACLDFHRNPATVTTSSVVQVRQPLYDSSLEQWRHYERELAPVRERLQAAGIAVN